jgi:fido (protein-threonine AMPylation protein)
LSNDKYGSDQAPDCYPGTDVLVNLLDLRNAEDLDEAERYINEVASARLEFIPPPYSLATLKRVHRTLFEAIYPCDQDEWIKACIHSYHGDDDLLVDVFNRCIGISIADVDI